MRFREPARWSFRFTSSDPDPLTRQPEVTVPQAGTGRSGFDGVGSTRSLFALDRSGFDVSIRHLRSQIENVVVKGKGLRVTKSDPDQYLPTSVQKSYFMLSRPTRTVLDTALWKYRPGRTDLIPVGGIAQLKPALRLMTSYRLMIRDVVVDELLTSP
jgi:hypothetical protein